MQSFDVPTESGELSLTLASSNGRGASVVIMPSAYGVADDLGAQMRELAEVARLVVAFDPFSRTEPGVIPYPDMARVMARLRTLDRARAAADFRAAIGWVRAKEPSTKVIALGICFGGPFALALAADRLVDGVVTWHGTGMEAHLERASEMNVPMRLHFGSVDPFVSAEAVGAIRAAFASRDDVRVLVHEGATHGFSHRDVRSAYQEAAERASLASVRELVLAGR